MSKKILMTGCGSSIGAYIREQLVEQGHSVFGVGLDGPDYKLAFDGVDSFNTAGRMVAEDAFNSFKEKYDGIGHRCEVPHVLINNAGVTAMDWTEDHTAWDFAKVFQVNVIAPYAFIHEFVKRRRGFSEPGRIVNTISMAYRIGMRTSQAYTSSKAALAQLTRSLAKEFAGRHPITVFGVAPGPIGGTRMLEQVAEGLMRTRGMDRETAEAYACQSSLGRPSTFEEIWKVYDFVVNDAPDTMSGSILDIPQGCGY